MPRASDQRRRERLARLEAEARQRPSRYRARLVALVVLGFAAPLGLALLMLILAAALLCTAVRSDWAVADALVPIVIIGELVVLVLAGLMLWQFLLPPPLDDDHQRLRPGQAPDLLALIERVRVETASPPIDEIHLDMSINAAVASRTRFGIIGRERHRMLIGLPLLAAMTPGQFSCVVRHEFAHVRGVRSRFPSWISRMHRMWSSLPALNKQSAVSKLARRWISWYLGALTFYSLPARRLNEYEADASAGAVPVEDGTTMAESLIALNWMSHRINTEFWPTCKRLPATHATPPNDILAQISECLARQPAGGMTERWTTYERACRTPIDSSHPSMVDRLRSLGVELPQSLNDPSELRFFASLPWEKSALSLLGDARNEIVTEANARWKATVITSWRNRRAYAEYCAEEAERPCDLPEPEPAWRRLNAVTETLPPADAKVALAKFVAEHPAHGMSALKLGCLLLDDYDESAIPLLHRVADSDADLAGNALGAMLNYYRASGRDDEADVVYQKIEITNRAIERFSRVGRADQFDRHLLTPMQLDSIRRSLTMFPHFRIGYAVRRVVQSNTGSPVHLVAIETRGLHGRMARRSIESARNHVREPVHIVLMSSVPMRARKRIRQCCADPIHFDAR